MFFRKKKENENSQNVKNKVYNMENLTFQFKIDKLTYLMIDELIREKCLDDGKIQLDTNRFLKVLIDKALKEFIRDHQHLLTQKLDREISSCNQELEGKEIKIEDIFKSYSLTSKAKEGD